MRPTHCETVIRTARGARHQRRRAKAAARSTKTRRRPVSVFEVEQVGKRSADRRSGEDDHTLHVLDRFTSGCARRRHARA